jgi:hypothetical protein
MNYRLRKLLFFTLLVGSLALTAGCTNLKHDTREYGTTVTSVMLFKCDGETWVSNEANERVCVMRSKVNPNKFIITQDQAEGLSEGYAVGLLQLFWIDDTQDVFYKAANQYIRKIYGTGARISGFTPHRSMHGWEFEVVPEDQIPQWLKTGVTSNRNVGPIEVKIEVLDDPSAPAN